MRSTTCSPAALVGVELKVIGSSAERPVGWADWMAEVQKEKKKACSSTVYYP